MEVIDRLGNIIKNGDYVRYDETGTTGKVIEINNDVSLNNNYKTKDFEEFIDLNIAWIKVDSTNLYYLSNVLEIIDKSNVKLSKFDQYNSSNETFNDNNNENNSDDFKEDMVEELKNQLEDLENIELSSNVGEGGG
ncbi:MAG: DUF2098 domain-containing protein [Methanobrevibacter sp.]|jgi:hypothetical protein|nr:DUF2098 domain-containing protein [Candidatus Methanoflexus mossambicus]